MGDTSWLIYEASTTLIPKTRQGGKTTDLGPLRTHRRKNHLQNPSALNAAAFGTHPAPRPGGSVSGMQGRLIYEGRRPTVTEEKQEAVTAASAPGEAPVGVNALSPRRSPRKHRRKQLLTLRHDRSPVSSTHPPGGGQTTASPPTSATRAGILRPPRLFTWSDPGVHGAGPLLHGLFSMNMVESMDPMCQLPRGSAPPLHTVQRSAVLQV